MILHHGNSSGRKFAWETAVTSLPGVDGAPVGPEERMAAAEKMRHQLYMMDPCERRMSIEECVDAILARSGESEDAQLPA